MMYCKKLRTPLRVSGRRFNSLLSHTFCHTAVVVGLACMHSLHACKPGFSTGGSVGKLSCAVLHAPVLRVLSAAAAAS